MITRALLDVRLKIFASKYGYQEKLHEDYEKRLLCDEAILMYVAITSKTERTYIFMCHVPHRNHGHECYLV